jgi:thiol:disulfide interchange protein
MGLLFIILGTCSSLAHKLPQSGSWMDYVKTGFAVIFVAMGMRYLSLSISELREAPGAFWATAARLWS